jgi:hypothetical protein
MVGRAAILIAGLLLCAGAVATTGRTQEEAAPPPPGAVVEAVRQTPMGPICWAAIVESIRQIGQRCHPGENLGLMAELDRSNDALGAMFLERGWSEQQLEGFRRQMGEADKPTEQLCSNKDAIAMYRGFASTTTEDLTKVTDEMLARPGPPEWGTCL